MKKLLIAITGAVALSGCWSIQQRKLLNQLNNRPDVQLCMVDNGIDPNQVKACVQNAEDSNQAHACIVHLAGENRTAAYRCILKADAEMQARFQSRPVTSVTVCNNLWGC